MAKTIGLEVSSTMSISDPEGALAVIGSIGSAVFDKRRRTGYYVGDSPGVRPKDQHFRTVERSKTRFVHFSRSVEPYGTIGAKFIKLLTSIDPNLRDGEQIGGEDLETEISRKLKEKIGESSLVGHRYEFTSIDDVPSSRDPDRRLFVLRQEHDTDTDFDSEPLSDIQVIDELGLVTSFVGDCINIISPEIFGIGDSQLPSTESGLLIGSTDDLNPDRIRTFKERFMKELFKDGDPIVAEVLSLQIESIALTDV